MCITLGPADLRGTRLYAGVGEVDGKVVHVIAYQNSAKSAGPNAMILPIPAAVMPGERNVIDTRDFADFLFTIHAATEVNKPRSSDRGGAASAASVFDVGSYTVVLAEKAGAVVAALSRVPPEKRPAADPRLLAAFEEHYPGWPLALCCWRGSVQPEPLLWWYEPKFPDRLFAQALDAHDGGPPDLGAKVKVDHYLAFGAKNFRGGAEVWFYQQIPPEVQNLLPDTVWGTRIHAKLPNGDFWLDLAQLDGPALRRAPGNNQPGVDIHLGGWERDMEDGHWAEPKWSHWRRSVLF